MKDTDITALAYEDWVSLVYDHPCAEDADLVEQKPWYWDKSISFVVWDPARLIEYVKRMCLDFPAIAGRFTLEQVDQGVWFLLGDAGLDFRDHLLDPRIPIKSRVECIQAMEVVFARFLAKSTAPVMEHCFDMWWDCLAGYPFASRQLTEDTRRVQQAMFDTLVRILAIKEERCQHAALHGLGHLNHPGASAVVQAWLNAHRKQFPAEEIAWVEECRDGTVM